MSGDARSRCVDALNRVDQYAATTSSGYMSYEDELAMRHLVQALDRVINNNPTTAEYLEAHIAAACDAIGVDGP